MRVASVFSDAGIAVICAGLFVTTLAGAEPAGDALSGLSAAAKSAAEAVVEPSNAPPEAPQASAPAATAVAGDVPKTPAPSATPSAAAPWSPTPAPAALASPATVQPAVAATASSPADQPPNSEEAPAPLPGVSSLKSAKALFGAVKLPTRQAPRSIGSYAKGCIAGAQAIPIDGPTWQVMRLSRNRNWGHPKLIALIEKLAGDAKAKDGWPGLLIGDLSQPRGGPMVSGHASHQIGLDVDIWLTPMPDHTLTRQERETMGAASVLSDDSLSVVREKWSEAHTNLIKRAASYPEVERVLVHPAIKQVLCYAATGDRGWLTKVRPYWGHDEHIHIRIGCPSGSGECQSQAPPPGDEGCGKELEDWLKRVENVKPQAPAVIVPPPPITTAKPSTPSKEKPSTTLVDLPEACRPVLAQDNPDAAQDIADAVKVEKEGRHKAFAEAEKEKAKATKTASASKLGGPKPAAAASKSGGTDAAKTAAPDAKKN